MIQFQVLDLDNQIDEWWCAIHIETVGKTELDNMAGSDYYILKFFCSIHIEVLGSPWVLLVSTSQEKFGSQYHLQLKRLESGECQARFLSICFQRYRKQGMSEPHFPDPQLHGVWESEQLLCENSIREEGQVQLREKIQRKFTEEVKNVWELVKVHCSKGLNGKILWAGHQQRMCSCRSVNRVIRA